MLILITNKILHTLMSQGACSCYRVNRENNTAVASVGSNNAKLTDEVRECNVVCEDDIKLE